ncbi:hypothetical protein [Terriglobus saanensis]|uniref:Uncharacterized protein n=1 Tax=Terriglobus saanensis (strain ATCC BAA-1853 / DSM 23119 / SP1PR4) TaxID=401053 RepID=E8V466_TERSS|nr:hypothetical protein [Terriglobus saanensis]ADV82557.1 hypothetical protein AciPR4_1750 [Terriglobus saanensis SP1PR4]
MAIRFATEPQNGSETVRAGLDRLAVRENKPPALRALNFSALTVTPPHAIYDLHADEIAKGGGLETAHATGFRYYVAATGASVAAAEVHTDASGKASLLANLNYGPFVEATSKGFTQVATLPSVSKGSYEARALRFSAIGLMAIWLKSDPGGTDIIYPLAPAPPMLEANRSYTAEEFLTAIRPLAQKRAANTETAAVP